MRIIYLISQIMQDWGLSTTQLPQRPLAEWTTAGIQPYCNNHKTMTVICAD